MGSFGTYNQDVTYWAPAGESGFGTRTFVAPILIKARWEEREVVDVGGATEIQKSGAKVFVDRTVVLGGYLAIGDYAEILVPELDPRALSIAHIIKQYIEVPALSGNEILRKVLL